MRGWNLPNVEIVGMLLASKNRNKSTTPTTVIVKPKLMRRDELERDIDLLKIGW